MSHTSHSRNRWMLPAPKPPTRLALDFLSRSDVWVRVGLCLIATTILWLVFGGWSPPFSYRLREAPLRNVHARVTFPYADLEATEEERNRARQKILCLYENDPRPLEDLRQALIDDLFAIKQNTYEDVAQTVWARFAPPPATPSEEGAPIPESAGGQDRFDAFQKALVGDERLETVRQVIQRAFINIDRHGLLKTLGHELGDGSMREIEVYLRGNEEDRERFAVSEVRIAEAAEDLRQNLIDELAIQRDVLPETALVAEYLYNWLVPQLPVTLRFDEQRSRRIGREAADAVATQMKQYQPGDPLEKLNNREAEGSVIAAGTPLDKEDISLLRAEHEAFIAQLSGWSRLLRSILFFGLFAAVFSLTSSYLYYRDRGLLLDIRQFATLLGLMLVTLLVAWALSLSVEWRSEIVPLVLFAMTIALAYNIELAILLGVLVGLAFSVAQGFGLSELVILTSASSTAALLCKSIRSRSKLVYIGMMTAAVVFPTVIGVEYMLGQPFGSAILMDALWFAGNAGLAGLFMTALLPFVEQLFDIQTDIHLLELNDANHPLLRELVQRAPGTYNHSVNLASISEAAAEAIGANGLLCRVGAYFHDIGKLRKPEYFIENQAGGVNKHDELVPTMSTLVIIAHVKDGAEIGRVHRLPKRIIDLIEQHHGTTLVEYFYRRATRQNEELQEAAQIEEADFRYPGPKPQTREAAVMMLSDAVESASRALREPTPARIESLVRELAKKRLDDGQFDQCSITIKELNTIQESLIKSLNAMYHSRVKYPDQQTA